jgi:hypothetical protein
MNNMKLAEAMVQRNDLDKGKNSFVHFYFLGHFSIIILPKE